LDASDSGSGATGGLLRAADLLDALIDRIGQVTGWFALMLVLVMSNNVLMRYVFHTGTVALQELEWHLMAPICMFGLSYAILKDGHVQVDILYGRFPARVKRLVDFVSTILVVLVVAYLMKLSIPYVQQSYAIGEQSPDPGGLTHRWILKATIPLGFALLLVQSIAAMLRALVPLLDPTIAVKSASHTV